MPITITPLPPGANVVGWGTTWQTSTDFIGPLPSDTVEVWWVSNDAEGVHTVSSWQRSTNQHQEVIKLDFNSVQFHPDTGTVADGQTAYINVQLKRSSTGELVDSGQFSGPWNGQAQEALAIAESGGQGGLTPTESQQLLETHEATFPAVSLDSLTLTLLPADPTTGFVGAQLPFPVWGVIVRMTQLDPLLVPGTPDDDYFLATLAVVRIFRGQDLWQRVPIHTTSKMVALTGEGIATAVTTLLGVPWLLNMSLQVTFRNGCLGDVFLMRLP